MTDALTLMKFCLCRVKEIGLGFFICFFAPW